MGFPFRRDPLQQRLPEWMVLPRLLEAGLLLCQPCPRLPLCHRLALCRRYRVEMLPPLQVFYSPPSEGLPSRVPLLMVLQLVVPRLVALRPQVPQQQEHLLEVPLLQDPLLQAPP